MWACVGFAVLAGLVWLLVWRLDPNLRRGREYEAELATREPVSDEELVSRYFATCALDSEVPVRVRRVFAKHMAYPTQKLLPDDDLEFFWAELDMVELVEELESGFGIVITQADTERTPCTIRAVSLLVASKRSTTSCRD